MQGGGGRADVEVAVRRYFGDVPASLVVPVAMQHVIGEGLSENERRFVLLLPRTLGALDRQKGWLRAANGRRGKRELLMVAGSRVEPSWVLKAPSNT